MEAYIGQIILFGGNFAPQGWAFCNGQLLSIAQYSTVFALLGTTYGGDGLTTFALPDLRSRAPVHTANTHPQGEVAGSESVSVLSTQIPIHTHGVKVATSNEAPGANRPGGNVFAESTQYSAPTAADGTLGGITSGPTGGNQPHNNMQPYLAVNYIICLEGIFPSRN
ncbi:MAG: phage tail protein [Acidobacteria bacterium]|nr:phage tail protein [Acidobacteriota bacterium]